jgi:hypothetical protein
VQFGDKGFGLVAAEFIPKETFIIQYIGEVLSINSEEGKRRLNEYSKSTCTYMMRLSAKEVIDPTYKGNMARFINHSCDPNCETRKWNVRGEIEVGIISIKDIQKGEELTFDYKFDVYQTPFTRCLCGSAKCKGYLGLVPVEYTCEEWEEKIDNLPCEICGGTTENPNNQLLLCDICNNGYHTLCCDPQILTIPQGAWFCSKCKVSSGQEEPPVAENPIAEKVEPPPIKLSSDKPLKIMLAQNKKLRIQYTNMIKKGTLLNMLSVLKEKEGDDPYLSAYNEFFIFQSLLQLDVVQEFLAQIKRERREKERAVAKEKQAAERAANISASKNNDSLEKTDKPQTTTGDDEGDDDESTEFEDEETQSVNLKPQQQTSETKGGDDKMKLEVLEVFNRMLKSSDLYERLKQKTEREEGEEISRTIMPVSAIEMSLFKASTLMRLLTLNTRAKLFWDNSRKYADMFAKAIEFNITGTKNESNLIKDIFKIMDDAIASYKKKYGFTEGVIKVPAIYLKRILGELQNNIHHVENEFGVRTQYDKRFLTDECYALHETAPMTLKGFKDNIIKARNYYQGIINELTVHRIYMSSSEIKEIIHNLITIKQSIHPSEIRCCRDNALRDINHPFFTIYYKDKEVAFVGTKK